LLHKFRNRFRLKILKIIQATSADEEDAATLQTQLKFIKEGNYEPRHVLNCDELCLFWKKIPSLTYINKSAKQSSVFKAWKDRLTLVLCGNAAGHRSRLAFFTVRRIIALSRTNKQILPARLLAT
jgi:hypothetical protein